MTVKHIDLDDDTVIKNWQSAEWWLNRHKMKTCSICGEKDEVIFRCPDGKDRCVVCCTKYESKVKEEKDAI